MKIAIGSDHAGLALKEALKAYLDSRMIPYEDFGTHTAESCDYPRIAEIVCKAILSAEFDRGILICGTGIGISMAANKIKGIRCALISDLFTAQMAKAHNNANFIAFGGRVHYNMPVTEMIDKFIGTEYEGGRHDRRIAKLAALEDQC